VITTPTAPHSFTSERFAALRASVPAAVAALPTPRVAVILGGSTGDYPFSEDCHRRLALALRSLAKSGVSFLITPSRRTHKDLISAVDAATSESPRILWDGEGANPYAEFLAHADALIVTADSVNMTSECAATGRPVYVFMPAGGSAKFERFHASMRQSGAVRPLPDTLTALETWTYTPLEAGRTIAVEIERRALAKRARRLTAGTGISAE
jgi:mitochondrial fission protein ELM1